MTSMTPDMDPTNEEWVALQTYANYEQAAPLLALLGKNGITYNTLADEHRDGDGLNFDLENRGPGVVHVLVLPQDVEKASHVLELLAGEVQDQLEDSDYLASFSDEELYEVLKKFDEWNQVDYVLAARLLVQRGHQLDEQQLKLWRGMRMQELERPIKASSGFLAGAYAMALLGGVFGLPMGLQLRTHMKRLPDGRKVHGYTAEDRKHGMNIVALSIIVIATIAVALIISKS